MAAENKKLDIEIKVGGATDIEGTETKDGKHIHRFHVDQRLDAPDFFSISVQAQEFNEVQGLMDKLGPGKEVEIAIGYGKKETIFKGEISYLEPTFSASKLYLTFSGYDKSHRLTRGTNSRTVGDGHEKNQNPADILKSVVGDAGGAKGGERKSLASDGLAADTASAKSKLEYIAQYNLNDYQFIQQVVGNFGMGWKADSQKGGNLSLKPLEKGSKVLGIYRDKPEGDPNVDAQAVSANFRCSTVRQVAAVEVRSWNWKEKKPIKGFCKALSSAIGGEPGHKQAGKAHYQDKSAGRVVTVVDVPVGDEAEANEVAQALFDKFAMDWMTADVVIEGRPKLHAGCVVELKDFGKAYSGEYFVESVQHVFTAGSSKLYRSYLKLARNASTEWG